VFQEVDETLKQKLSKLMFEGPGEELNPDREHAAGADGTFLACWRVLEAEGVSTSKSRAIVAAGHSLGEYSALCAVGAFSIPARAAAEAARPVPCKKRFLLQGAMAALLGADRPSAEEICAEAAVNPEGQKEVVEPANDNGGGQVG